MSRDELGRVSTVWERAAKEDPYFAVLSDPELRGGRWDSDCFFATGEGEGGLELEWAALRGQGRSASHVDWEMHGTPERVVRRWVEGVGETVRDVAITNATDPAFNGALRYLSDAPARGWVSKQYCVVKSS